MKRMACIMPWLLYSSECSYSLFTTINLMSDLKFTHFENVGEKEEKAVRAGEERERMRVEY